VERKNRQFELLLEDGALSPSDERVVKTTCSMTVVVCNATTGKPVFDVAGCGGPPWSPVFGLMDTEKEEDGKWHIPCCSYLFLQ
jgi:hypothetical protein